MPPYAHDYYKSYSGTSTAGMYASTATSPPPRIDPETRTLVEAVRAGKIGDKDRAIKILAAAISELTK